MKVALGDNRVMSFGPPDAKYRLVEFIDYECPYCRRDEGEVEAIASSGIRIVVRQLPLTTIHPFSMRAAMIAETAKTPGEFFKMNRWLLGAQLSGKTLAREYSALVANVSGKDGAERRIRTDVAAAAAVGIEGTPGLLLVGPSGQITQFPSIESVAQFLRQHPMDSSSRHTAQARSCVRSRLPKSPQWRSV